MEEIILRMQNISKSFPGVQALKNVSLDLRKGEVHSLLGENGAGKSTLMKCLAGIYPINSGTSEIKGKQVEIASPMDSIELGISVIHQELVLAEQLTVADNIFMGREFVNRMGFIDRDKINSECNAILEQLDVDFDASTRVFTMSTAQRQMLEIAKALSRKVEILVMDEPTAAVSQREVERIFEIIQSLKAKGITIVYISHRMDEILRIADRITVLRDGTKVDTVNAEETDKQQLVRMMIGYNLSKYYVKSRHAVGEEILRTEHITRKDSKVRDASFVLHKGEIIGFAGLVGSGRTELIQTVYGIEPPQSGSISLYGKQVSIRNPRQALDAGICLVPEDRKFLGLFLGNHVRFNLSIGILKRFIQWKYAGVNISMEQELAEEYIDKLSIKVSSQTQKVVNLSGGNQQKIVIGKWLLASKDIIILDEPTRGVDVGAKAEIYALMDQLIAQGKSIIMISSELPELINMSDRIYVMRNGEIIKEFDDSEHFDQEEILSCMMGVENKEAAI